MMHRAVVRVLSAVSVLGASLLVGSGCGSDSKKAVANAKLSEGCLINSDCSEPLKCAFRRCHQECSTSRDCPDGQRCLASDRPFHVCQLDDDRDCKYNSECQMGLVCGRDGECRDQCGGPRDCLPGMSCVSGTCADQDELNDNGDLLAATNDEPEGQRCTYSSECPSPLACRGGVCAPECLTERDCAGGACVSGVCEEPEPVTPPPPVVVYADAGRPECTYHSDCLTRGAGFRCLSGACRAECVADVDCASSERCQQGQCVSRPVVTPDAGPVPDASAGCTYNSDCASLGAGHRCISGECRPQCVRDVDCNVGETCSAGACVFIAPPGAPPGYGDACNVSSDCDPGLICRPPGRCVFECVMNADCGVGFCCSAQGTCLTGSACVDSGPLGGGPQYPDVVIPGCTTDLNCQDGVVCNGFERCVAGSCRGALRAACDDGNPCTADACDEASGACTNTPTGVLQDADGDGHYDVNCGGTGDDCDDRNGDVHPGAAEVCDGVDNNCNGTVDEGGWDVGTPVVLPSYSADGGSHTYPALGRVALARRNNGTLWVAAGALGPDPDRAIDMWRVDAGLNVLDGPTPVTTTQSWVTSPYAEISNPRLATNGTGYALGHVHHVTPGGTGSTDEIRLSIGNTLANPTESLLGSVALCCNPGGQRWPANDGGAPTVVFNGTDYIAAWADESASGTLRARIAKLSPTGAFSGVSQDVLVTPGANDVNTFGRGEAAAVHLTLTPAGVFVAWVRPSPYQPRYVLLDPNALSVIAGPFDLSTQGFSSNSANFISAMAYTGTSVVMAFDENTRTVLVRLDATTGAYLDMLSLPSTVGDPTATLVSVRGGLMLATINGTVTRYGWIPDNLTQGFPLRDFERGVGSAGGTSILKLDDQNVVFAWTRGGEVLLAPVSCNASP